MFIDFLLRTTALLLIIAISFCPLSPGAACAAGDKESASQLDESVTVPSENVSDSEVREDGQKAVDVPEAKTGDKDNRMWLYGGLGVAALAAGVGLAAGGGGGGDSSSGSGGEWLKNTTWNEVLVSANSSYCKSDFLDDTVTFRADYTVIRTYHHAGGTGGPWRVSGNTLSYTPFSVTNGLENNDYIGRCPVTPDASQYNCHITWPGCSVQYRLVKR